VGKLGRRGDPGIGCSSPGRASNNQQGTAGFRTRKAGLRLLPAKVRRDAARPIFGKFRASDGDADRVVVIVERSGGPPWVRTADPVAPPSSPEKLAQGTVAWVEARRSRHPPSCSGNFGPSSRSSRKRWGIQGCCAPQVRRPAYRGSSRCASTALQTWAASPSGHIIPVGLQTPNRLTGFPFRGRCRWLSPWVQKLFWAARFPVVLFPPPSTPLPARSTKKMVRLPAPAKPP